jgi:hypothetical protein
MTRTISELHQAATNAGWTGDPLAEEILAALLAAEGADKSIAPLAEEKKRLELELKRVTQEFTELRASHSTEGPNKRFVIFLTIAVAISCVTTGGWVFSTLNKKAMLAERERDVASRDAEIIHLKETNTAQLAQAAHSIEVAASHVQTVAKSTESAADANEMAVKIYLNQFQKLLENFQKVRDADSPPSRPTTTPAPQPAPH